MYSGRPVIDEQEQEMDDGILASEGVDGDAMGEEEILDAWAGEILSLQTDEELDEFLGRAFKAAKRFANSATGRALKDVAKRLIKQYGRTALQAAGTAAGAYFGGPTGAKIGGMAAGPAANALGLELEGLSPDDQSFEVARTLAGIVGTAARTLGNTNVQAAVKDPQGTARRVLTAATRKYAPALVPAVPRLLRGEQALGTASAGQWRRVGNTIVISLS